MLPGCGGGNCFTSLTDLAKMSPQDTQSILFVDFKKLMSDSELGEVYADALESFDFKIDDDADFFGYEDIHYFAKVNIDFSDEVVWLSGDIDMAALREFLNEYGVKDNYLNVERWWFWEGPAIAIYRDAVIISDGEGVNKTIETIAEPDKSIYEANEDIRDAIRELPDGLAYSTRIIPSYMDSLSIGVSVSKLDSDSLELFGYMKFEDGEAAEFALGQFVERWDSEDFHRFEATRSENSFRYSAEIDMEDSGQLW